MAVDVETTGLDFDTETVIELAGVRFRGGQPEAEFQALLPPGKSLTAMAKLLTGIGEEALRAAPPAAETLRAFQAFAGDLPLVAHNADFDSKFVRRALERDGLPPPSGPWLDSLLLARMAWPTWESHRLESLAARLGLPSDSSHRALPDALRAGLLFLAAQRSLGASAASETSETFARMAKGLPGWESVFAPGPSGIFPRGPEHSPAVSGGEEPRPESPAPAGAADAATDAMAEALRGEAWLALQLHAGGHELETGLRSALLASGAEGRVLFVVPDMGAWNEIRRRLWPRLRSENAGRKLSALGEPQNYLCRRRLSALAAEPGLRLPPEERLALLPLLAWEAGTADSLISACRGFSAERVRLLWSRTQCESYEEDPGAKAARAEAEGADVIVVTQAAFFSHLRLDGALLPVCDAVVFSGAHRLLEAAPRFCGCEVSFFRLRNLLQLLRQAREKKFGLWPALERTLPGRCGEAEVDAWFEPEKLFHRFLHKIGRQAEKRRSPGDSRMRYSGSLALAFDVNPEPLLASLKRNEHWLQECARDLGEAGMDMRADLGRAETRLREFRLDLEKLCEAKDEGQIHWVEDFSNPHKATIRCAPADLEACFGGPVRRLFRSGVFVSKSFAFSGPVPKADFLIRSLGLGAPDSGPRVQAKGWNDPHPPRFLLASFAPAATTDGAAEFARFLAEAAKPFPETGFFLFFPSLGALRATYLALRALLPREIPVWAQHLDGGRDALAQLFASGKGGWVLATEGMEGLRDAVGRPPAVAVVARMPLPSQREPWFEALGERLRSSGRNPRHELLQPHGVIRLQRELAPALETGALRAVWFLDGRAAADGLGAHAGRAMGCAPVVAADLRGLQNATAEALTPA